MISIFMVYPSTCKSRKFFYKTLIDVILFVLEILGRLIPT